MHSYQFETLLEKLARITTRNYGVRVEIRGNRAETNGKVIYLPMLVDIPEELYQDMIAFADHESAHITDSDFEELKKCKNRYHFDLLNGVEDSRIEICFAKRWPGTKLSFKRLNAKWGSLVKKGWANLPWPIRLNIAVRQAYDKKDIWLDPTIAPIFLHIKEKVLLLDKCTSTRELRIATEEIVDLINQKREELAMGLPSSDSPESDEDQTLNETPVPLNKDKGKEKKKLTPYEEIDPAVEYRESPEGEDDDKAPTEPDDADSTNTDFDLSDPESESDGSGFVDHNSPESLTPDEEMSDESGEYDNAGSEIDNETSEDSTLPEISPSEHSDVEEELGDLDPTATPISLPASEPEERLNRKKNQAKWVETEIEKQMMEETLLDKLGKSEFDRHVHSAETYMAMKIEKEVENQPNPKELNRGMYEGEIIKTAISLPYSKKFDVEIDHSGKGNINQFAAEMRIISPMVSPIRASLERVLKVKENAKTHPYQERGLIDTRALAQLGVDKTFRYPFKIFSKTDVTDVAVLLLIDLSASMWGEPIVLARRSALALSKGIDGLNIPLEVLGFHSEGSRELAGMVSRLDTEEVARFNRFGERLVHEIFKSFDCKSLIGITEAHSGGNNCDGESLLWAASRLALRPEKRKIMLVLSDGQPHIPGADLVCLAGDLKRCITRITQSGIELVGIGIQTDTSIFYPDSVVVDEIENLPRRVINELAKKLEI